MVKVTDIFYQVCDEQAKLNEEEVKLIQNGVPEKEKVDPNHLLDVNQTPQPVLDQHIALNQRRKDSLQKLVEASVLVAKVLISNQTDRDGELVVLGISELERKKLLTKADSFYGSGFEGGLREGQSFLQASVSSIKEILEDYSWGTLDDLAQKSR